MLCEPLFERHASGATLTGLGARLVAPAMQMANGAAELGRITAQNEPPRGVVRITAPPGIAHAFVAPFAATLAPSLPGLTIEVASTVRPLDIARREADIALRIGASPGEHIAAVALRLGAFASPRYASSVRGVRSSADVRWIG